MLHIFLESSDSLQNMKLQYTFHPEQQIAGSWMTIISTMNSPSAAFFSRFTAGLYHDWGFHTPCGLDLLEEMRKRNTSEPG
jgi:hypothetical protein